MDVAGLQREHGRNARDVSLLVHSLLWAALSVAAFYTAGPYSFASCWVVIPIYIRPHVWMYFAFAAYCAGTLLLSAAIPTLRQTSYFQIAGHGIIAVLGIVVCGLAATAAAGQVSCL